MKAKLWILSFMLFFLFCSDKEETNEIFFMTFKLREGDGTASSIRVQMDGDEPMTGNDILNSDQASIGFNIHASFENPEDKTITQAIYFFWSREIPKSEVTFRSNGIPALKDPARINEYLPRTNLFQEQSTYFGSYFIENVQGFCSAQLDPSYANTFQIIDLKQHVDVQNNKAIDITAEFSVRYLTACNLGDKQITNGLLTTRILL